MLHCTLLGQTSCACGCGCMLLLHMFGIWAVSGLFKSWVLTLTTDTKVRQVGVEL